MVASACCLIRSMRAKHFLWNASSPTDSASSTTRISGSTFVADRRTVRRRHAGRIGLDRLIEELADVGEGGDRVEPTVDFPAAESRIVAFM